MTLAFLYKSLFRFMIVCVTTAMSVSEVFSLESTVSVNAKAAYSVESEIVIRYLADRKVAESLALNLYSNDYYIDEYDGVRYAALNRKKEIGSPHEMYLHQQHIQIYDANHNVRVFKGLKVEYVFGAMYAGSLPDSGVDGAGTFRPSVTFAKTPEIYRFDDYTSLENPSRQLDFHENPNDLHGYVEGVAYYGDVELEEGTDAVFIPFNVWYAMSGEMPYFKLYRADVKIKVLADF